LYSGGYRTATTKSRINEYSPAKIYQKKFQWFIGDKQFLDGVRVNEFGNIEKVEELLLGGAYANSKSPRG